MAEPNFSSRDFWHDSVLLATDYRLTIAPVNGLSPNAIYSIVLAVLLWRDSLGGQEIKSEFRELASPASDYTERRFTTMQQVIKAVARQHSIVLAPSLFAQLGVLLRYTI